MGEDYTRRIVKELTKIALTDLWREYNSIERDFWEKHEEAIAEYFQHS
ncbi:MAG TPA: hypothetical protein HPP56_06420 [Nitrospirae bacterium]|nr:hypothetical protein [Nitrospirota bacterium]